MTKKLGFLIGGTIAVLALVCVVIFSFSNNDTVLAEDNVTTTVVANQNTDAFAAISANISEIVQTPPNLAAELDNAPATLAEVVEIERPIDFTSATGQYMSERFIIDGQAVNLLTTVFDETVAGTDYNDILFSINGNTGTEITISAGQVLYLSAGHYTVIMPNGQMATRAFGETLVANDYYTAPGTYLVFGYPTPTTPERGQFAAIGGKIFTSTPSLLAELQGSFERPVATFATEDGLREASQDGMAKAASYSRFVLTDGTVMQTEATVLGDRVTVTIVD